MRGRSWNASAIVEGWRLCACATRTGDAQLASRRLTSVLARTNQRSRLVDVNSACRGKLQRRGGLTGMCNTARPSLLLFIHPLSLFLSLSVSLSFVPVLSTRLPQIFISGSTANWSRRARPAFLPSDTTLLNLNLLREAQCANRRLAAREKKRKKKNRKEKKRKIYFKTRTRVSSHRF